jgi:hypothetical protein
MGRTRWEGDVTLTDLAKKYHSDRLARHSYIPFYESLFEGMRVAKLLEVGIGYKEMMEHFSPGWMDGAGVRMWRDYFPEATIYACDIRPDVMIVGEERIRTFVCDQGNPEELGHLAEAVGWDLDVVIDDGSHEERDQLMTAAVLLPRVRKGGLYIVEDVRKPEEILKSFGGRLHAFGKTPDDNLVVIGR